MFQIENKLDKMVSRWGWVMMIMSLVECQQNQFYQVLAPDTVRPNTNYFVAISVDGTGGELQASILNH